MRVVGDPCDNFEYRVAALLLPGRQALQCLQGRSAQAGTMRSQCRSGDPVAAGDGIDGQYGDVALLGTVLSALFPLPRQTVACGVQETPVVRLYMLPSVFRLANRFHSRKNNTVLRNQGVEWPSQG
ncbi:hypothetical protein [Zoogloea sp. LCSB751]|uniref:hypothetical protein n=1 Tax=Zoogloea sp. LCSB751 TaxID=1965277 RepID=UPI0011165684|nr:hypothetical protein [Zoogloea sp. LCSB751]